MSKKEPYIFMDLTPEYVIQHRRMKNLDTMYGIYLGIELRPSREVKSGEFHSTSSFIYPKYVVLTGRACKSPHPHRHHTKEEFIEKYENDPEFKEFMNSII
jgi:hypothetical protein